MDLQPNKTDGIYLPITNTRISASEWNQLVGSCMAFITEAGLTPDASDNEQFLNAFKTIAAGLEIVGANTNLSNLTATGEARFTTKADTDLSNVSTTGKATAIGWGMPDYDAAITADQPYTAANKFTAPADGILIYGYWSTSAKNKLYVNDIVIGGFQGSGQGYGLCYPLVIPLSEGDTFYQEYANNNSFPNENNRFIPFKGVN